MKEKVFDFQLRTLGPVAVGDGDQTGLSPHVDYVLEEGRLYLLDRDLVMRELADQEGALERWRRDLFAQGSRFSLADFLWEELGGELSEYARAELKVDGDFASTVIRTVIKTGGRPYFPGSTLKGTFMAACFWDWLVHAGRGPLLELVRSLERLARGLARIDVRDSKGELRYKQERFKCQKDLGRLVGDLEADLFGNLRKRRFMDAGRLQFGDARPFGAGDLSLVAAERFHLFQEPWEGHDSIPVPTEAVVAGAETRFRMKVRGGFSHPYWRDFRGVGDWLAVLDRYRDAFLEWELPRLAGVSELDSVVDFYRGEVAAGTAVRLGQGNVWHQNSVGLALAVVAPGALVHWGEVFDLGHPDYFPKTRVLARLGNGDCQPLGWVGVEGA